MYANAIALNLNKRSIRLAKKINKSVFFDYLPILIFDILNNLY